MTQDVQKPAKITPMFEQFFAIKEEYQDSLLFFRMGDFYELFFADAEVAARELQITLTSRNSNAENPIPMCGVPHHSAEIYITQLTEKGYKVAICEQIEDPKTAKGLVKRAVTLVRTPGTAIEDASLQAKNHNYIGALYWDEAKSAGGFAWLDYSTGEWSGLYTKKQAELWQWVEKMQPKELLLPDLPPEEFRIPQSMFLGSSTPVRLPVRSYFDTKNATNRILKAQQIQELGAVGLSDKEELTKACGALLGYLVQTQKQELTHLLPFAPLNLSRHLIIDEVTERNLEIFRRLDGKKGIGTLWHVLDETLTPMGGRLLEERLRHPWRDKTAIENTVTTVAYLHLATHTRLALRKSLCTVYDLERLSTRIFLGRATPKDFIALKDSLIALENVAAALTTASNSENTDQLPPAIQEIVAQWDSMTDVAALLSKALTDSPPLTITEGGLFKQGYSQELDELIDLVDHAEQKLQALLLQEQQQYSLPKLKLGYNRVFGYYFELSKSAATTVPEHFVRKQTIANGERYITPALKELEDKILAAAETRKQLEYKLFHELRHTIINTRPRVLFMAGVLAAIDYWQCLAEVAHQKSWVKPTVTTDTNLIIKEGRHPVVENMVGPSGFIANDLTVDEKRRLILITGPNMAGKSTVLRQAAIITLLAQMGSFVPAKSAIVGIADRIFSRVGASDNLAQGQSTFMVEMMETARILRQATKNSLVILDEIGRGTSTFDGLSIAWAVVEELLKRGDGTIRTLFATHYHELTALEGRLQGIHNMNIAIREWNGDIIFLRRLIPGPSDRSYGIEVAKLAGVPQQVVTRAKKILLQLEKSQASTAKADAAKAMQQLLPGISAPQETRKEQELLPEKIEKVDHPLLTTLQDLDTNTITPMQALNLITEWKLLWGAKQHDTPQN